MRVTKTVTIPIYTREVTDYKVCDICHNIIEEVGGYDVDEVILQYRNGSSYPAGSFGETESFDICPDCFNDKIKPFIISFGSEPQLKDWG
jgi:hypothetical protein